MFLRDIEYQIFISECTYGLRMGGPLIRFPSFLFDFDRSEIRSYQFNNK